MPNNKIGLFGGAFNPPHYGHLILAQQAYEELGLDRVLFIPTGIAAHRTPIDPIHRVTMTKQAVIEDGRFFCSSVESIRTGKSYMIDTIRILRHVLRNYQLSLIVGQDHLDLLGWKDPDKIRQLVYEVWSGERTHHSSTEIRARVAAGLSIRYYVPEHVRKWIQEHQLYCSAKTSDPLESFE